MRGREWGWDRFKAVQFKDSGIEFRNVFCIFSVKDDSQ